MTCRPGHQTEAQQAVREGFGEVVRHREKEPRVSACKRAVPRRDPLVAGNRRERKGGRDNSDDPKSKECPGNDTRIPACCDTGQERVDGTAVAVCRVVEIESRADWIRGDERVELPVVAELIAGCRCQALDSGAGACAETGRAS